MHVDDALLHPDPAEAEDHSASARTANWVSTMNRASQETRLAQPLIQRIDRADEGMGEHAIMTLWIAGCRAVSPRQRHVWRASGGARGFEPLGGAV